mmetsp:Transcript_50671/g.121490  ORF Transcript_50671/g.121490 Transcript_50671/m.121490 type:complete len:233 (-) Transcript_50671:919-1617(-)
MGAKQDQEKRSTGRLSSSILRYCASVTHRKLPSHIIRGLSSPFDTKLCGRRCTFLSLSSSSELLNPPIRTAIVSPFMSMTLIACASARMNRLRANTRPHALDLGTLGTMTRRTMPELFLSWAMLPFINSTNTISLSSSVATPLAYRWSGTSACQDLAKKSDFSGCVGRYLKTVLDDVLQNMSPAPSMVKLFTSVTATMTSRRRTPCMSQHRNSVPPLLRVSLRTQYSDMRGL